MIVTPGSSNTLVIDEGKVARIVGSSGASGTATLLVADPSSLSGDTTWSITGGQTVTTPARVGSRRLVVTCTAGEITATAEEGDVQSAQWNLARTGLVHPVTGEPFLRGEPTSGAWMTVPSVFRLRLTGTGTVTLDAKDSLGNITSVAIYAVTGATDQIEFPYAGDDAVAIRATLTGTATCEVI